MDPIFFGLVTVIALLIGIGIGRWSRNDLVNQVAQLEASLSRETERNQVQNDLKLLLDPVNEQLQQLRMQAKTQREAEVEAETLIRRDLEQLRAHSDVLAKALGGSAVRGTYGEGQLELLMESAGLIEGVHYEVQQTIKREDGNSRPDVTIKLPNGQTLFLDSKFPFDAYWDFVQAEDPEERAEHLKRHQKAVRQRIKELNDRKYFEASDGPNFVILFFPYESIWHAAIESDSSILQFAQNNRVVLTTPATLHSVLGTVSYAWQRNQLAENAFKIGAAAEKLLISVAGLVEELNKIGNQLNTVATSYNRFATKFDNGFVTSARKLRELAGATNIEIEVAEITSVPAKEFQGKALNLIEPESDSGVV